MGIETVVPLNKEHWLELRKHRVNSTEVSALFGLNKYKSHYQLWHEKKGLAEDTFQETERTRMGNLLENVIAEAAAAELDLKIRKAPDYMYDDEFGIAASFDYFTQESGIDAYVDHEGQMIERRVMRDQFVMECKNVDGMIYKSEWLVDANDDGTVDVQAPTHIELQLQTQMALSGLPAAYLVALVGGNTLKIIKRERDEQVIDMIKKACKDFWQSIHDNQPPDLDYSIDAEFIISRYGHAEPGSVLNLEDDEAFKNLALEYTNISESIKALEAQKEGLKARMLQQIGEAEKVRASGFSVTAGLVGPCEMNYTRKGYRQFRINWPRKKAE